MTHEQTPEGRRLGAGLLLLLGLLVFEIIGAVETGSLALLGDAGHVLMDAVALGASFIAARVATRQPTARFTFGFARIEIVVAFANGLALLGIACSLVVAGILRAFNPHEVRSRELIIFAAIGLVVNLAIVALLRDRRHGRLNIESAYWHVLGDTLSSVFVVAGALLIAITGKHWFDLVANFAIGSILLVGALRLVRRAGRILLEGTETDLVAVAAAIRAVPGVEEVHHIHARTLTDGVMSLTARVHPAGDPRLSECAPVLSTIEGVLRDRFGIRHVTIQFETPHTERVIECTLDAPPTR